MSPSPAALPSNQDAEQNSWNAPAVKEENEEPARKKPRTDVLQDSAAKKRNQRMFGVVMGTLNKFKAEGTKQKQSDAAKRRTDIENKLATKLKVENQDLERKSHRFRTEKQLKTDVLRKQDERSLLQSIHKTRQSTALHLANFLCTTPSTGDARAAHLPSLATIPFESSQPQHAAPAFDVPVIYYLPSKLLPSQTDKLSDQAAEASKLVEADKAAFVKASEKLEEEIAELKEKRDKGIEDLEREDRAQRAEKERQERDQEDSTMQPVEAAGTNGHAAAATPTETEVKDEDAAMEEAVEF